MPKVLHVLEHSIPRLVGYTIRSKYIIENQAKQGIDVVVITSPLQGETAQSFKEPEMINGIKYYRTGEFNELNISESLPLRLWRRFKYSRNYLQTIEWVARAEGVDIIHSHSSYLNGVRANQAARRIGIPCVYEVRGLWQDTATVTADIDPTHWKYKFVDYMDRKAMKGADRVVAIARTLKDELAQHKGIPEDRIRIVPNGVDTGVFQPRPKSKDLVDRYGLEGKTVFGFIGSISRIEGLSFFLNCLPAIIKEHKQIKVVLVGDGAELGHLKQIVAQQGLGDDVIFPGRIAHEKILDYYSIVDVFLYPRINAKVNHSVTPLKPLEAMAMEKVVLASDVGGLRELVLDGENGILFRVDDAAHLTNRCVEILKDKSFRETLSRKARQWVVREREWSVLVRRYRDIYSELDCGRKGSSR